MRLLSCSRFATYDLQDDTIRFRMGRAGNRRRQERRRIATVTFKRIANRFLVLMAVLAALLAAAVPGFAQEQVSATGVLLPGLPADVGTNGTHAITDEASATVYVSRVRPWISAPTSVSK